MDYFINFFESPFIYPFVLLTIVYLVIFFVLSNLLQRTSKVLSIKNDKIKAQRDKLKKINERLHISNLKIDQQNFDLKKQYEEIKIQKENIIKKTVDLLVVNREQRENLKLREGLTNMIVHDLKNPISNIINLSENKEISYFANYILTMIENILDVQKYEGVIMPLKKSSFSLNEIIADAEKQISLFAQRKNIKIINKIENNISVFVDEEILKRAFINFLSNSVKYSYANKNIIIEAETIKNNRILIKIIDTGIGIKEDKIHLIFDKFSQVMAKKTGSARSSGLGLAFCKIAVQAHRGGINVKSIPNKYTTFSFDIELSDKKCKDFVKDCNVIKSNNVVLGKEDKLYLKVFLEDFQKLEVYEIGKLRNILENIDDEVSQKLSLWKTKLNQAIYNCNSELYRQLVSKIL